MTTTETILELISIKKRFGNIEALKGVDLRVEKGEFFGFLGPNGAGKSTLMKIFSGFLGADEGSVFIKGRQVTKQDNQSRMTCGLVPQEIALYQNLSPLENIRIFGDLYKIRRKSLHHRGQELLESVELWDRRHDRVKDFSGGMKRRLNIVVSLLHQPEILLCDEPTVGVDPQSRNAIFEFLEDLNQKGLTIMYTTHYMEEAERLCKRIAIIDHGSLLACGALGELMQLSDIKQEFLISKGPGMESFADKAKSFGKVLEEAVAYRVIPTGETSISSFYKFIEDEGIEYERVVYRKPSLESLFLQLTGHRLRD